MRSIFLLLPVAGLALVQACVGDQPDLGSGVVAADAGADATVTPVDPTPDAGALDAGPLTYGAFLTAKRYPSNFAREAGDAGATRDFVDAICTGAATAAGLEHASAYRAVISVSTGGDVTSELGTVSRFSHLGAGRWCQVAPGEPPRVDCNGTGSVIFATPDAFRQGPGASLVHDENGLAASSDHFGEFYSGFALPADAPTLFQGRVRDCTAWTIEVDASTPGDEIPASADWAAGIGSVLYRQTGSTPVDYAWLAAQSPELCSPLLERSLLCLELPVVP